MNEIKCNKCDKMNMASDNSCRACGEQLVLLITPTNN